MGNTYRLRLVWTRDDAHVGHGRHSRARNKPISRRIQRREQRNITRTATAAYYAAAEEFEPIDYGPADDFNAWYSEHAWVEDYDAFDLQLQQEYDFTDYYGDYDDYGYADDCYSFRRQETPYDRIIKTEDAGKSLGELLEEIQQR